MKSLRQYLVEDAIDDFENGETEYVTISKETVDIGLVMDIKLYSEQNPDFKDRKIAIANKFKEDLYDVELTVDRISKTKIFNYYIIHLIEAYKNNIDENACLNVSSENELRHQIATDIVLCTKQC